MAGGLRSRDKYIKVADDDPSIHHYAKVSNVCTCATQPTPQPPQDAEREEQERRQALAHYKRKVVLLSIALSTASVIFTTLAYLHCAGHHRHHNGAVRGE